MPQEFGLTLLGKDTATGVVEEVTFDPSDLRAGRDALEGILAYLTKLGNRQDLLDDDILAIHAQRRIAIAALPKLQNIERASQVLFSLLPKMLKKSGQVEIENGYEDVIEGAREFAIENDNRPHVDSEYDHAFSHVLQSILKHRFGGHALLTMQELNRSECHDLRSFPIRTKDSFRLVVYNPSLHSQSEAVQWANSVQSAEQESATAKGQTP